MRMADIILVHGLCAGTKEFFGCKFGILKSFLYVHFDISTQCLGTVLGPSMRWGDGYTYPGGNGGFGPG